MRSGKKINKPLKIFSRASVVAVVNIKTFFNELQTLELLVAYSLRL
jgi:hypothetical protein